MSGNGSLKGKRRLIKSLLDRIRVKFPSLAIVEVDSLDLWDKATIGTSYVSNNVSIVNSVLDKVISHIESVGSFRIGEKDVEIIHF